MAIFSMIFQSFVKICPIWSKKRTSVENFQNFFEELLPPLGGIQNPKKIFLDCIKHLGRRGKNCFDIFKLTQTGSNIWPALALPRGTSGYDDYNTIMLGCIDLHFSGTVARFRDLATSALS